MKRQRPVHAAPHDHIHRREIEAAKNLPPLVAVKRNPTCERCGKELRVRYNGRTKKPFWACSGFPRCNFTRPMRGGNPCGPDCEGCLDLSDQETCPEYA